MAGRGIAVVGCLALVGAVATTALGRPSAGQTASAAVGTGTLDRATATAFRPDVAKMTALLRKVAAITPSSAVSVIPPDPSPDGTPRIQASVGGVVTTPSGSYVLTVSEQPRPRPGLGSAVVAQLLPSCTPRPQIECILGSSATDRMITYTTFGPQTARNDVSYTLNLPDRVVMIHFSNLVVDDRGTATTGPDAAHVGFTYVAVSAVAKAAGL
jgi:hypothetical protein